MRRRLVAVPATLLLLTGVSACGGGSDEGGDGGSASGDIAGLSVSGDFGKAATVKVDGLDVDGAETEVAIEGDGAEVTDESALRYRFAVANGKDGEEVLTNFDQPEPESMTVADQPPAIKDAIEGSTIGSRVVLAVPVVDVLGEQGAPQAGLGPKDDVVFVFDLLEEAEKPLTKPEGTEVDPPSGVPPVVTEDDTATGTVTGLDFADLPSDPPADFEVIPLVEGEGPAVKEGDEVTVNYYGAVWGEDEPFDSSFERGEPTAFPLTKGGLIDGWVQGLEGVKAGSRVMLVIPPDLGYGEQGSPPNIPGGATLVFVIDVLGVNL